MLRIEDLKIKGYEKVWVGTDPAVGLTAIIAIHNTYRGPACGGVRVLEYNSRQEAVEDVLRLAKAMSYKSSLANIGFGGGKSVVICNPQKKNKALFKAFGEMVSRLDGEYIAAKDMNIEKEDLLTIKSCTPHVLGIEGEKGSSGDPSSVTARGVYRALEATLENILNSSSVKGVHVAIQGIGHVGFLLAKQLVENGAEVSITDINLQAVERAKKELKIKAVPLDAIYDVDCEVFSPCARGAVLNNQTIPRLKCRAVVGAANNQLATPEDAERLHNRNILYAPDYAANAGGVINIFAEYKGRYQATEALKMADNIYHTLQEIFRRAKASGQNPTRIADQLAEERMGMKPLSSSP